MDVESLGVALNARKSSLGLRQSVATRAQWYSTSSQTNSLNDIAVTYRSRHTITCDCSNLQFVFGNSGVGISLNPLTMKAILEFNNQVYPIFFNGQQNITIAPHGIVASDPVGIFVPAGTVVYVRTYVTLSASGQNIPLGLYSITANGEGKMQGDQTGTIGNAPPAFTTSQEDLYTPLVIKGIPKVGHINSVALFGDSITYGTGPSDNLAKWGISYAEIPLINNNIPYVKMAQPSESGTTFMSSWYNSIRLGLLEGVTHAIVMYGTNDLAGPNSGSTTLANIQSGLTNLYTSLANHGIKVYACTVLPRVTASGSSTAYNARFQGTSTGQSSGQSDWMALNAWIRSVPAPLSGYFETEGAATPAINSGLWNAGYTSQDGTHPNSTGHQAISAAINVAAFN